MLQAENLSKSFGPVRVLDTISLKLKAGEIHAVVGENGAGKSTLMKLLAGLEAPSAGRILLDDAPVHFASPADAERHGIVLVPQEQLLADALTVSENLFLGRELRRGPLLQRAAMRARSATLLATLGCDVDPDAPVARLSVAMRQMVQIARALLTPHRIVIFDEPTAVLTAVEADALFRTISTLRSSGVGVLYISHRLAEVSALADRITVLRDGQLVGTYDGRTLSEHELARAMVGRPLSDLFPPRAPPPLCNPALEIDGISVPGYVSNAALAVRPGELVGLAGMVGAGRTELFEGLLGLRPARIGTVRRNGVAIRLGSVAAARRAGIAYLTEDRKAKGLLLDQQMPFNLTLTALRQVCRGPFVDAGRERAAMQRATVHFDIRARNPAVTAGRLSGGNQQKLLLAKTMLPKPGVVVIDEPTRGIDVGTKGQIYRFLADLAAQGLAIVVISSELSELIGLCHRVLVMRAGRIVADLSGEDMTEDGIVIAATGAAAAPRWAAA